MDKPVDIFMHNHKIFVFITSAQMNGQFVVAMDFVKPQFFSCNRTSPILRRIREKFGYPYTQHFCESLSYASAQA